jgi:hypothetical protein
MIAIHLEQPQGSDSCEFVLISVWKNQGTLARQNRQDWTEAMLPPEALPFVEEWHVSENYSAGLLDLPLKSLFISI